MLILKEFNVLIDRLIGTYFVVMNPCLVSPNNRRGLNNSGSISQSGCISVTTSSSEAHYESSDLFILGKGIKVPQTSKPGRTEMPSSCSFVFATSKVNKRSVSSSSDSESWSSLTELLQMTDFAWSSEIKAIT